MNAGWVAFTTVVIGVPLWRIYWVYLNEKQGTKP